MLSSRSKNFQKNYRRVLPRMNFSRKIREEASPGRTQRILEKGQMSYRSFVSEIREPCIQQKSNTDPTGLTRCTFRQWERARIAWNPDNGGMGVLLVGCNCSPGTRIESWEKKEGARSIDGSVRIVNRTREQKADRSSLRTAQEEAGEQAGSGLPGHSIAIYTRLDTI